MTAIIASLSEIQTRYSALFVDLWGCLHNGVTPFPKAVAALQGARKAGVTVVLLTNSPRPSPSVIAQLDAMGVPRDAWDMVTSSGDAAQYALVTGALGRKVHHIGAPKDMPFFDTFAPDIGQIASQQPKIELVPMQEAEGIVCTGLRDDQTETPQDYRADLLMGKTLGLPMLCANPDIVVDFGDKRLWCAGALAKDYEEMGARALYFGKPHPPIYDLARRRLREMTGESDPFILCIGDGIHTDVQGGLAEGMDTLFITGGLEAASFGPDSDNPDPALLTPWLAEKSLSATFAMGHLR